MASTKTTHGGARPGAGRPALSLADLALQGRFKAANHQHRVKLKSDYSLAALSVPAFPRRRAQVYLDLVHCQARYLVTSGDVYWALKFEDAAAELAALTP